MSRMARTSRKFDQGVGFSNGWAELALKKPAAVCSQLLDRNLRCCRSDRQDLFGRRGRLCFRLALFIQHRLALRIRDGLGISDRLEQCSGVI